MGAYDDLSPKELARIRRFVEGADIDTTLVSDELRDLVEKHWPWLLPNLEPQTLKGRWLKPTPPIRYYTIHPSSRALETAASKACSSSGDEPTQRDVGAPHTEIRRRMLS
jgi:hypothetical protein